MLRPRLAFILTFCPLVFSVAQPFAFAAPAIIESINSPHLCPTPHRAGRKEGESELRISGVSDPLFSVDGGEEIKIRGSGFLGVGGKPLDGLQVFLGVTDCQDVQVENSSTLHCTTSPHAEGYADVVIRNQARCDVLKETVLFSARPILSPRLVRLGPGEKTTFKATRTVGTPHFSMLQGNGTIDEKTGEFQASAHEGTGIVQVRDDRGIAQATFNVYPPFSAIPLSAQLKSGESLQITPSGGVPPYTVEIASGGGKIETQNDIFFPPPQGGNTELTASDSAGNSVSIKIVTDLPPPLLAKPELRKIAVGSGHSCVVIDQGVQCWGDNHYGQLLLPKKKAFVSRPTAIAGLQSGVRSIVSGLHHLCALMESGDVKCWGSNQYGQLGVPGPDNSKLVSVKGLPSGIRQIAAGDFHTCVATPFQVLCWGRNDRGQLGDGTFEDSDEPVVVQEIRHDVHVMAAGAAHTCIIEDKTVKCWGRNYDGQLGTADNQDRAVPAAVEGLSDDTLSLAAGRAHTCALNKEGIAKCWGFNGLGSVGNLSKDNASAPIELRDIGKDVTEISASQYHTCAVINARAECWGSSAERLKDNSDLAPLNVAGLSTDVVSLAPGAEHSCALLKNQRVKCWGENSLGELGDGSTRSHLAPVDVLLR
jgi:alpha-tubulin suppressor-like RCC1 family protein